MITLRILLPGLLITMGMIVSMSIPVETAFAHERRDVGPYRFTVGFIVEPAYEAIPNAVSVRVVRPEGDQSKPVAGLEQSLKVEVSHVATGRSKTMDLRAVFGDLGHYRADLIPTLSGQYRFRFFGKVEDSEVNEVFESGPGRFNDVSPQSEAQFPESVGSVREVQAAVRGANAASNDALDRVESVSTLAVVATVLGGTGLVAGGIAVALSLRRRSV